jgi:multidrug efflux pump
MSVSDIFIRRPVLSTVLACMILLLGFQGIFNLTVRQYPEVEETVITITTTYPGANPELIQGFITAPIASAVSTTENIDYVTSQSRPSASVVTVQMQLGADPDVALTEVMSKVQQVRGRLPSESEDPVIVKGTGQQFAIMYLAMQNPNMSAEQVTEYLERVIRPRLSTVEGVAEIQILGAANYAMRVWIDPVRLGSRGLTAAEVLAAINASNFLSAPGRTENEFVSYSITMRSTLQTAEGFSQLPLRSDGDEVVRLRDVADVELAAESTDTIVNFNGRPGTFVGIFPTPSANPLDTAAAVIEALPSIQATLPDGAELTMVYNATETISASIVEVFKTIAEAVAIVVLIILLFLGSFRSVLMPIVTIPLSLIGVCFFLLMAGYSINLLSLLAMVLAIGLVVDDAIVVVENIHRHIEEGMTPRAAAFKGMSEITGPVVAMTITLAAVFAPLAFTGGLTGSLFREFAFTLAGAVVISGVVALTITPMMAARVLKAGGHSRFQQFVDRSFERIANRYERLVAGSLNYRPVTLMVVVALMAVTGFMFFKTSTELAPEEDSGALFSVINAPRYATTPYTALYANQMRELTADLPEQRANFSIVGLGGQTNSGFSVWALKEWAQRELLLRPVAKGDPGRHHPADFQRGGRAGLRLRAALAAGRRRRPADLRRHPVDRRSGAGLRGRRAGQERGAGVRPLHRGAEHALLRRAAGDDHHRPRPGGRTEHPRPRDRHDAGAAGRRRAGGAVRPRFQQLRHHHPGAARISRESATPGRLLRAQPDR